MSASPIRRSLALGQDGGFESFLSRVVKNVNCFAVLSSFEEQLSGLVVVDGGCEPPLRVLPRSLSRVLTLLKPWCIESGVRLLFLLKLAIPKSTVANYPDS